MSSSSDLLVSKEILCHDFRVAMHGKLEPHLTEAAVRSIQRATSMYGVHAGVVSAIFYLHFDIFVKDGKKFAGHAGGLSSPGGGTFIGHLFTEDINKLYANTVSFQFNGTSVYFNVNFFDGNSNLLGHIQAGAISIVSGIGGGTGSWS